MAIAQNNYELKIHPDIQWQLPVYSASSTSQMSKGKPRWNSDKISEGRRHGMVCSNEKGTPRSLSEGTQRETSEEKRHELGEELCVTDATRNKDANTDQGTKRKLLHYTASVKNWPRVYKSQEIIRDLVDRCSKLEDDFQWHNQQQKGKYLSEIDIYIDSSVEQLDPKSLLVRGDSLEKKGTMRLHVSKRNMPDESFSLNKFFSGIFIDEEGVKLVEDLSHEQIFVVVLQSVAEKPFVEQSHQFELQRAILEISSLLESVVFEILTVKCETLKQLYPLQANQSKENMKSSFSEMESQRNERARELLGEMFAFFNRSTLPKNKRMDVPGFERKRVSREITEKLFDLDKTIRGCGYSHSTFNVNVERLPGEKETMDRKERITKFLEKHGINDIKLNIVSESVAEYKRVGAGISIPKTEEGTEYHKGTLGGFASFSKEKETSSCALFSRHVAHGCIAKVYVDGENGKMTELGEILEDTLQAGSYDIAAAKIHDHHVPQCEVEFKNSENTPLPGRLYSPATIDLQDLQVHLWGSASKPGLGIIKIPELSYPNATETYIQIEDRNISKRMAAEGDSGAIVCADDLDDEHVHVISMLIGSNSDTKTLQDPNVKRTYIAFPVQKGVERLQMKTGGTFSLQGVSNDQ